MDTISKRLEILFEISHPRQLKKSCQFLFFSFLMNQPHEALPEDIGSISSDIYMILDFLEYCEDKMDPLP